MLFRVKIVEGVLAKSPNTIELHCVWTLDQPYEESYEWYVGSMTCGDRINHIIAGPQHSFANFQY